MQCHGWYRYRFCFLRSPTSSLTRHLRAACQNTNGAFVGSLIQWGFEIRTRVNLVWISNGVRISNGKLAQTVLYKTTISSFYIKRSRLNHSKSGHFGRHFVKKVRISNGTLAQTVLYFWRSVHFLNGTIILDCFCLPSEVQI